MCYQNKDDSTLERWKTAEHYLSHAVLRIRDSREQSAPKERAVISTNRQTEGSPAACSLSVRTTELGIAATLRP